MKESEKSLYFSILIIIICKILSSQATIHIQSKDLEEALFLHIVLQDIEGRILLLLKIKQIHLVTIMTLTPSILEQNIDLENRK